MIGIITVAVINIIILIFLLCFIKRTTIPFGIALTLVINLIVIWIANPLKNLWAFAIPLVPIVAFCAVKYQFPQLNYDKRILNLAPFRRPFKEGRVIGKCFPYYKKQLKYNHSTIIQSELAMKGGTILTGSSGSGKTYGIINSIAQDLDAGRSVAFFDFKGDVNTFNEIKEYIPAGVEVYKLTNDECNFVYDPLDNLDDNGKAEAILQMRKWSLDGADDHYKTGAQLFLQKTIREYNHKGGNYLVGYYNFLKTYNVPRELYDSYNTIVKLLELTLTSNINHMFKNEGNKFSFRQSKQFILFVSFTSGNKALGTSLTSLMLRDLMEVGTKCAYSPTLNLYIDEFGSCDSPLIVKDILEKGRSCNIATVISMQDLNQLIINTNAPFMDSVLGTVNSYIIYSGATRNTAEKLAGTQIYEIDNLLMTLKKPIKGNPPTVVYISKYPVLNKSGTEVYRLIPNKNKFSIKKANDTPAPETEYVDNPFENTPEKSIQEEQAMQPNQDINNIEQPAHETPQVSNIDVSNYL